MNTVGYTECSIQLGPLHGALTLHAKEFSLHVRIKVQLEIIMNERKPVGSMCCQSRTFPVEDKTHGRK